MKKKGKVQLEEVPGTSVNPEDGPWPKEYTILETDEDMWRELRSLARPHRTVFVNYDGYRSARSRSRGNRSRSHGRSPEKSPQDPEFTAGELLAPVVEDTAPVPVQEETHELPPRVMVVDSVNFQPCKTVKTQDRYVVTQLDVHGEIWTLTGVFDGHLGDVTVEHVAHHLPIIIREFLKSKLPPNFSSSDYDPNHISTLFQSAIMAFDDAIAHDVLDLFGGSLDQLDNYTEADIREIINDHHPAGQDNGQSTTSGENWRKARLCMYGTTALVALIDPKGEGVWVANLGDCVGILVTQTIKLDENDGDESEGDVLPSRFDNPEEGEWTVEVLTTNHNGDNAQEIERIKSEHPGEEDTCIVNERVLGALAPTRCLGDIPFKQPPDFTRRILYNLYPYVHNTGPWEAFLRHNKTPPYLTAQAEVVYRRLKGDDPDQPSTEDTSGKRRHSGISAVLGLRRLGSLRRGRKAKKQADVRVRKRRFLVLASDGFTSLCLSAGGVERVVESWAKEMVQNRTPRQEVEETKRKLSERANDALTAGEERALASAGSAIEIPCNAPTFFGLGDTSPLPVSPASITSPVPFTANSFSSSVGSLVIPGVEQEEQTVSGMSTPAYSFSALPTRTASPAPPSPPPAHAPSAVHLHHHAASRLQPSMGSAHGGPAQAHLHSLLDPQSHSSSSSSISQFHPSIVRHQEDNASASAAQSIPLAAAPMASLTVPRLQRPPLPNVNKSYHCTSSSNMALRLLRRVLGGEKRDNDRVAKASTIDMDVSWLDDTSIVVLGL